MFCYVDGETLVIEEPGGNGDTVLFGLRPCDARSFTMLDKVFEGQFSDVYYLQKREKTTLIGLACTEPCVNCFCPSVGGSPSSTDGLDILLTDCDDEYAVDVITDKGVAIIAESAEFFEAASENQQKAKIAAKAEALIQRKIPIEGVKKQLDGLFYNPIWNELARECVGCSICTFLCPTCHCFDIRDEPFGNEGRRVRVWDSCSNPEYTLHASGHNPRPGRMHRTRNRLYHKYHCFPERFGVIACVGCGRCITKCPVNIDIIEMLEKIQSV
jgi:ferredoxin